VEPDHLAVPLPVRFDAGHIEAFRAVSYDQNPLHSDPVYARKTQFGEPIVFGVGVVLGVLGRLFSGRRISIRDIKVTFLRPVFIERDYRIEAKIREGVYFISVTEASSVHLRIKLTLGADRAANTADGATAADCTPPRMTDHAPTNMRYSLNWLGYDECCRCFELPLGLLSPVQINALLWSSYFVGMVNPGTQGLFTTLEFTFDAFSEAATAIELVDLQYELDDRHNTVHVTGMGTGISRFALNAMRRPLPIQYSMLDVGNALAQGRVDLTNAKAQFDGKRVFVSGGSRGLGSVFARGLAVLGAVVIAGCRYQSDDADALAADLVAFNPASGVLAADLADASAFRQALEAAAAGASFDFLVCAASPVIKSAPLRELEGDQIIEFIARSLALFLTPLKALLPRVASGGRIIVISSVYAARPEKYFGHYVAAKRAIEGLTEVLAKEHPTIEFMVFRPVRFLSDQTNAVLEKGLLPSAVDIFEAFLNRLLEAKESGGSNLRFFDS